MRSLTAVPRQTISVVVPLFNEEENLPQLYRRLTASLSELDIAYELVLVNDGSRDATPELLNQLAHQDEHVTAVQLSRNFGHQAAVSAGLDLARGDAVIVMDGDLQDPPEVLRQFIDRWRDGFDVVYAVRTKRKEGWLKRSCYFLFYRVFRWLSDLDIPLDSGDFGLMDQKVVKALRDLPEKQRFVRGLRTFVGFRQTGLVYERAAREAGRPKYSFTALVRLARDGIFNFTTTPLNFITYLAASMSLIVFGAIGWLAWSWLVQGAVPASWLWATLTTGLLGSLNLLCLSIIGEYLRRIFAEVKNRPTYVVAQVTRKQSLDNSTMAPVRKTA